MVRWSAKIVGRRPQLKPLRIISAVLEIHNISLLKNFFEELCSLRLRLPPRTSNDELTFYDLALCVFRMKSDSTMKS